MSRLWLTALGAAAVIACGDDDSGGGPTDLFPDVAGTYVIAGQFDGVDPSEAAFTGTILIEQESLESSILTGTANITITGSEGTVNVVDAELLDAAVDLGGNVSFHLQQGAVSWNFLGERAGDVLEGTQTLTLDSETRIGSWSGER